MIRFILNDADIETDQPPGLTVLDFVRYRRHLMGTKIGCREGDCGACTVLVGSLENGRVRYRSMTSCLLPLASVQGKHVASIEGINPADRNALTPVQQALVEENGTQCGFCTVGFVMSLTGACLQEKGTTAGEAEQAAFLGSADGNICRCTGYKSIERAAARLFEQWKEGNGQSAFEFSLDQGIVPAYFKTIPERLLKIAGNFSKAPLPFQWVAGGTDLYVQRPEEMAHAALHPLSELADLRGIREKDGRIEIGAAATVSDWLESPTLQAVFPKLSRHLKLVSSTSIRNMATVAGNLVNASPIGDLSIWLLAMDATVVLEQAGGKRRELPLREFYLAYKALAKTPEEMVVAVRFDKPAPDHYFNFEKVSKRTYLDIASVNAAISITASENQLKRVHLSMGGVAPVPLYLKQTSLFLRGKQISEKVIENDPVFIEAAQILQAEIKPIGDVRGSERYKRLLAERLLLAHLLLFKSRS